MIHRRLRCVGFAALVCAFASHAQGVYPSVSLTSDYRYNGVSYSDGEPAPQLSVHVIAPARFHAGLWASRVDFDDPGDTSIEVDLYAGNTFRVRETDVTIEALYTFFPDKSFRGPTYDFLQAKVDVSRRFEATELEAQIAWTPEASYASGEAIRIAMGTSHRLAERVELSANLGRRWIEHGHDRTYWDIGTTLSWRKLALDLRYVDTNLSASSCSAAAHCDASVVATLTLKLW